MTLATVLVGACAAIAAIAAGLAVGRRSTLTRRDDLAARLRNAENELQLKTRTSEESQQVQELVLSSMEEGVLLLDAQGAAVFSNPPLTRHLGKVPARSSEIVPLELQRAARRAAYIGGIVRVEAETGSPSRWLRGTAIPVLGDGSVLLVVRDVTDARRLDAIRRDFVANASHELKTPAASIQAAAETLLHATEEDPDAVPRFVVQLDREAIRLSRIIADLLDLSRLESGSELADWVRLDVVARDEAQRLEEAALEAKVQLEVRTREVPALRGSARDMALLVRNLVDNAIRYSREGGRVEVEVENGGGSVRLRVIDTGMGIPSRDLPRVFERFYRVDRARARETGGTGLGLAIVKHVAENHGGEVTVESELGRGTTFTVDLPAVS